VVSATLRNFSALRRLENKNKKNRYTLQTQSCSKTCVLTFTHLKYFVQNGSKESHCNSLLWGKNTLKKNLFSPKEAEKNASGCPFGSGRFSHSYNDPRVLGTKEGFQSVLTGLFDQNSARVDNKYSLEVSRPDRP